ncbi:hypothetical protein [Brevundimonas denitrificans]|uniref:hypothetical protein n=1 Tax=Brevundimonas denitrificans TaxID=1443434 RepID=UPI00223B36AD|nr:hypothetical protein [Brevundimonas denitrificans]
MRAIAARPDAPFTVGQLRAVDEAVLALEALPRSRRSLGALRALLGQGAPAAWAPGWSAGPPTAPWAGCWTTPATPWP